MTHSDNHGDDDRHTDDPHDPSFPRRRESMDVALASPGIPQTSLDSRLRGNDGQEGGEVSCNGNTPALFLIGDPKQAIYGFRGGDVHAYLKAGETAQAAPPLAHNFRSRPALLAAIDALYSSAQAAYQDDDNASVNTPPFVDARIQFHPVQAGGKRSDGDFQRDDQPAPALTLWQAPESGEFDAKGKPKPHSAPRSRQIATQACVAAIHRVLSDAREGRASIDGQPVQPGDIAVLVRTHHEATRIQQALALAGIAAVAAGRMSLFETIEARELHALLLALLHTGDDARLRAALSTVLVGVDAAGIDALEHAPEGHDGDTHRAWQHHAMAWRERLLRGGPLALVGDLCASGSDRLLGLLDGERRVSNYLQLAEQLQEAQDRALGLHGLVDWLARRIATADRSDDTQLLRLESDARRVQIVTLHKSKGLEYPLVFLPFVGIGRHAQSPGSHCVVHDDAGRCLHWKLDLPGWDAAKDQWKLEDRAEQARLLYVGLTRAEHALWIASGPLYLHDRAPLAAMLSDPSRLTDAGIIIDTSAPPDALPRLPPESDATVPPARIVTRRLASDWWVYSFSQLSRADAGDTLAASTVPASGGNDEPDAIGADATERLTDDTSFDPRFAGNRYGVALHAALEQIALQPPSLNADATDPTAFATWRDWHPGDDAPADHATVIADALRAEGYGAEVLDDGIALTTQLIGHTLTVALPEGTRLCDLPADARRPEIEFQFSLQPTRVDALLRLLHDHGIVPERHGFGLRQRLQGLMTGLIDLTYQHDGRWYVLDYKSNRLPGYDAAQLVEAMAHGEYDLQALIYTLGAAPLAAFPSGQRVRSRRLRLRTRLRRHPLRVLSRAGCRQRRVARHPRAMLCARTHPRPRRAVRPRRRACRCRCQCRCPGSRRMSLLRQLNTLGVLRTLDDALAQSLRRLDPETPDTVLAAAALASLAVDQGHAGFDPARPRQLTDADIDWPDADTWLQQLATSPWVATPDAPDDAADAAPLVLEHNLLYLRRYREYERRLALQLRRIAAQPMPHTDIAPMASLFATLFPAASLLPLAGEDAQRADEGEAPTDDRQARAAALSLRRALLLVTGGPGTGKTTTIARLLALRVAQANRASSTPPRIALAAPTGRAAERMADSLRRASAQMEQLGIDTTLLAALPQTASTLHRLLGVIPDTPRFRFDADNPLPFDIVVVDEASMVDLPLMCKLTEAVADGAQLILLGDPDQLPSVEAGDVLAAILAAAGPGDALSVEDAEALAPLLGNHPA